MPLKFFDFHFIWKGDILDYFWGRSRRVCQIFYFRAFYAHSKKNIFQISIKYRFYTDFSGGAGTLHQGKRWASLVLYRQLKESTTIHFHRFVMELLQWQNFYKIGEDEVLRPPVVALTRVIRVLLWSSFSEVTLEHSFHSISMKCSCLHFRSKQSHLHKKQRWWWVQIFKEQLMCQTCYFLF